MFDRILPLKAALPVTAKVSDDKSIGMNPAKVLKVRVLGLDFDGIYTSYTVTSKDRAHFEESPYDFERIIAAIDTDTYVKQGFMKYKELFWKEGWEIISENPDAVAYLWQRIDYLEEVMQKPFQAFLEQAVDNLIKFGNSFIVEARGDLESWYPGRLYPPEGKDPIVGYYLIPTETVKIRRNKWNKPIQYRQSIKNNTYYRDKIHEPVWNADEVIHLMMDQKDGRPFGTPFILGALDDIITLRQMEEDIANLVHRDLFPLYKYTVGTEDRPSTPEELEQAAAEINSLRVDGGLILPERHNVEVIGGEGKALEATNYLIQFKERVAVGLGLYPHHLGIMGSGMNRSATDRLDIAVYDKVKLIQSYVEEAVRLFIFNPLLREGGFNPMTTPHKTGPSDRCHMRFREIDIDTQIKKETHIIQKFNSNLVELDETRIQLGLSPDVDPNQLLMTMTAQVQTAAQIAAINAQAAVAPRSATSGASQTPKQLPPAARKPDAVQPSLGGRPNQPNNKAGSNAVRPANQFGRRLSPNVRRFDDDDLLTEIVNLIDDEGDFNE